MPKYRSNSGGHVRIWVNYRPETIDIPATGEYETTDEQELESLRASSEVSEVKGREKDPEPERQPVATPREAVGGSKDSKK